MWFLIAADVVYAERAARMHARNPVPAAAPGDVSTTARWWERPDTVNGRSFSVVFVRPTQVTTAPPPGLPAWPAPGEVYLSPALLASDPQMKDRFGKTVGTISNDGLADAAEFVAYVNPSRPGFFDEVYEPTSHIQGFGNTQNQLYFVNSHQFDRGMSELVPIVLLMAGLPCLALIIVATRSRAELRDRRIALLDSLGAPASMRGLVLAGEALGPIASGVLAASLLVLAVSFTSPVLPFTGYQVWGADLRQALPWLPVLATLLLVGLIATAVIGGIARRSTSGNRPVVTSKSRGRWPFALFIVGISVAAWGSEYRGVAGKIGFVGGAVVTLVALPYAAAQLARLMGRRMARSGRDRGDAERIVAGRWLAARPATLARLSSALVVGLGVIVIGQVITTQFTGPVQDARARYQGFGAELVQVRSRNIPATAQGFLDALRTEKVLRYSPEPSPSTAEPGKEPSGLWVTGDCEALSTLGEMASCPTSPTPPQQVFRTLSAVGQELFMGQEMLPGPTSAVCSCQSPSGGDNALHGFVVLNKAGTDGLHRIEQAAYEHLIGPMMGQPGQSWYVGAAAQAAQTKWLLDIALMGLLALAAAGTLGAASIFLEQAKALGPLSTYRTDVRFYAKIAFWNLALPLGVVGVIGAAVAAALGGLMINLGKGGWMSVPLLVVGLAVVAIAGIAVAVLCGRVAARQALDWRPQGD
ncbi:hypothetical protein ACFRJ1_06945 [Streptomyces sp. NPDC056773]|uniref:hypothetical protein n=1 Tax=unclassified Streptomyces TaxID=2593676 RepID=UPI0036C740F8